MTEHPNPVMHIFVESERVEVEPKESDSEEPETEELRSIIHRKLRRIREEGRMLPEDQTHFLNSACDAAKQIGCDIEINDVGMWSYFKRMRGKSEAESIPRIEYNGKSLAGNPTVNQIIQYFS
ncbi:MAG: hypothetical protein RTU92_08015 [Candidatus Thorarchaeota archaeon]